MPIDSSHSRNYLTTSNNHLEPIHQISIDADVLAERQRKNNELKHFKSDAAKRGIPALLKIGPARFVQTKASLLTDPRPIMQTTTEEDEINRLPVDSSDEEKDDFFEKA